MAKRKNQDDTRARKAIQFIERASMALEIDLGTLTRLFSTDLSQSVRINPLAGSPSETLTAMKKLGWKGKSIDWCENGYTIEQGFEALRDSDLITHGYIYIQNRSSWIPIIALQPQPGESILDMCAAPGGKTSHIAALIQNTGRLVANDNSRPRLLKLQANMERLGSKAEFILHDATKLSKQIGDQQFDKILLDAPCSGEGLINLNRPQTLDSWSVAHIRRLASLQKQLILQAYLLLKPGGRLVYSTCTLAPEEDEMIIDWLLRKQSSACTVRPDLRPEGTVAPVLEWNGKSLDASLKNALRIIPEDGSEAFFTCIIEKK